MSAVDEVVKGRLEACVYFALRRRLEDVVGDRCADDVEAAERAAADEVGAVLGEEGLPPKSSSSSGSAPGMLNSAVRQTKKATSSVRVRSLNRSDS